MSKQIFIVGNGFDLAHDLKTSYADFMCWLIKDYVFSAANEYKMGSYRNDLEYFDLDFNIELQYLDGYIAQISDAKDFSDLNNYISLNDQSNYTIKFVSHKSFFKSIMNDIITKRWVDIEVIYFNCLIELYNAFKLTKNKQQFIDSVIDLNHDLSILKRFLIKYLSEITEKSGHQEPKQDIYNKILACCGDKFHSDNEVIFLNFNYTNTLGYYVKDLESENYKVSKIDLHGSIYGDADKIVFGYGDETLDIYHELENLNENEVLKNIKSFGYLLSNSYKSFFNAVPCDNTSELFNVYILGHSCGISDRILLKNLFELKNCQSINLFYYKRLDGTDDFFEKTQEISRHFGPNGKHRMRTLVAPKNPSLLINPF